MTREQALKELDDLADRFAYYHRELAIACIDGTVTMRDVQAAIERNLARQEAL